MSKVQFYLLSFLAIIAPAKEVLLVVAALTLVDLMTGLAAAMKRKERITSSGLKRTIVKVCLYQVAILCAFFVQAYLTGEELPVMKWLAGLIGLTELKSILENLDALGKQPVFRLIKSKLQSAISSESNDPPGSP